MVDCEFVALGKHIGEFVEECSTALLLRVRRARERCWRRHNRHELVSKDSMIAITQA